MLLATPAATDADGTAPPYEPGFVTCFERFESPARCDGDTSPGATSDVRLRFCLGWSDDCSGRDTPVRDAYFQSQMAFIPLSWSVTPGDELPRGALLGRLEVDATLGLVSNPCGNLITYPLTLVNATTDTKDLFTGDVRYDPDANGLPDGADHYPIFALDALDPDLSSYGPDLMPHTADDANGPLSPPTPLVRLFGLTTVTPAISEVVNVLVLPPGSTVPGPDGPQRLDPSLGYPVAIVPNDPSASPATGPFSEACTAYRADLVLFGLSRDNPCTPQPIAGNANCPRPALPVLEGIPLFACEPLNANDEDRDGVINDGCPQINAASETGNDCLDAISNEAEDGAINDGCPVVGALSEAGFVPDADGCDTDANEASCPFLTNPSATGPVEFVLYVPSVRDADGDGIDNVLDSCPYVPNPDWNPRLHFTGDQDDDGLADNCDPDPTAQAPGRECFPVGFSGADEDQDCLANTADNCPFDNQMQHPKQPPDPILNRPAALDSDGDGIGDACDREPLVPDGAFANVCLHAALAIGAEAREAAGVADAAGANGCRPGVERTWGDVDCDGAVGAPDALATLRHLAGLASSGQPQPCPGAGGGVEASGTLRLWGDVDCDGRLGAVDALGVLLFATGKPQAAGSGCPDVGSDVRIIG